MKLTTRSTDLQSDPLAVFAGLTGRHESCFLLETSGEQGYSYIGVAPRRHLTARGSQFYVDGKQQAVDNPYEALQQYVPAGRKLPLHYAGGLVGYLSHEALQYVEPSLRFAYSRRWPDFEFGQYDDGLTFTPGRSPEYFYYGQNRSELYQPAAAKLAPLWIKPGQAAKTKAQYYRMVEQARLDIQNGRVFQAVLANQYSYNFSGDLLAVYRELRRINPSPYMFFLKFGDRVTMGASPELLTHTSPDRITHLEALAGTIRRGATAKEDKALAAQLQRDEKEIAEHNMLVDLARNDVGRVSRIGSVQIERLKYIKKLSHVQHLCSLVSGRLAPGETVFSALQAAFPAGTLVGTPKLEAAKMIAEREGYERGPYGGTVGYFSYSGDSMHAVNIRSLQASGRKLFVHTGSGVVYDSQPAREYDEISAKKAAMDRAMRPFLVKRGRP